MAVFLDEILLHIFEYLDAASLTRLSSVCKQWRNIANTPSLWRRLVLLRWPSQKFLYEKASLSHINWMNTYQDLTLRGHFSPDEMKYFICCRVSDELTEIELRENMFLHMAETMMKWFDATHCCTFSRMFPFWLIPARSKDPWEICTAQHQVT